MPANDSTPKRRELKTFINETRRRFERRPSFKAFTSRLQSSTFIQFIKAIEPVALVLAVVVFVNEFQDREEDRIARSWQILATPQSTRSGTISALEFLNRQIAPDYLTWLPFVKERVSLDGVELLVPPLSEMWKNKPKRNRLGPSKCVDYTYLRKVQLADAILRDSTFACADLRHGNLRQADLARVDFRRALLWRVDFRDAVLGGANFEHADLWEADFRNANFNIPQGFRILRPPIDSPSVTYIGIIYDRHVAMWGKTAETLQTEPLAENFGVHVSFQHADLRRVDMRDVTAHNTNFQNADMRGIDLRNANLWNSNLTGANLLEAELQGTNLEKVKLTCDRIAGSKIMGKGTPRPNN